jgi:hypothetical protein
MLPIPQDVLAQFNAVLKQRTVPAHVYSDYRKWLLYFLDFRSKYSPPESRSEQVRLFIEKLRSKKQTPKQLNQAAHALSLFFASQQMKKSVYSSPAAAMPKTSSSQLPHQPHKASEAKGSIAPDISFADSKDGNHAASASGSSLKSSLTRSTGGKHFNEWQCLEKSDSPAWDETMRTTMIYTHCVPSGTVKEAKSPLDF